MPDYSYIGDGICIGDVYSVIGNCVTHEPDILAGEATGPMTRRMNT
jgi:hypothetical protein